MIGSIAANFHEGSRSEYLAQFVFSAFGTAVAVPHQEDAGLDLYCTLLERVGSRAWPRAYYSVQVKSTMDPWAFEGPESVRWFIKYPLPIFLCIVEKATAQIRVYQTAPRFAAWGLLEQPPRLELIPGTGTEGNAIEWGLGETFELGAPILNFTVQQVLEQDFRNNVVDVLKFWIDFDKENLLRVESGIHQYWVPDRYETNSTKFRAWSGNAPHFREESVPVAKRRLKELLGLIATHYRRQNDMVSAAIYAMALRRLSPEGFSGPLAADGTFDPNPHDTQLHDELNQLMGVDAAHYLFEAVDALLSLVKEELARHGITEAGIDPNRGDSH